MFLSRSIRARYLPIRTARTDDHSHRAYGGPDSIDPGGSVGVHGNDGQELGVMFVGSEGTSTYGVVQANCKDSQSSSQLIVKQYGGRVDVFNNQDECRAVIGVNRYGHGFAGAWDK